MACALLFGGGAAPAHAQVVAQGVEALDRAAAEQERLKTLLQNRPAPYVDKVMDPSTVPSEKDPETQDDGGGFRACP